MAKRPPAPEKPPEYEEVSEIYVDKGLFTGKRAVSFAGWFCEGDNFRLCAACDLLPVQNLLEWCTRIYKAELADVIKQIKFHLQEV